MEDSRNLFENDSETESIAVPEMLDSDSSYENEEIAEVDQEVLNQFRPGKKRQRRGKKSGRKSTWSEDKIDDLVDVVCEDEYLRRKIIFTNNKNTKNSEVYEKVLRKLKARCTEREVEFVFNVAQTRTKFKSLVAICKKASLTRKTSSGIEDFIQKMGYGKWFAQLFPYIQSRESAQPEQATEPSASKSTPSPVQSENAETGSSRSVYVPVKKRKTGEQANLLADAVKSFNKLLEKDHTENLMNFFKEENEQTRKHEERMMQMQMQMQMQLMQMMMNGTAGAPANAGASFFPQTGLQNCNFQRGNYQQSQGMPTNSTNNGNYQVQQHINSNQEAKSYYTL